MQRKNLVATAAGAACLLIVGFVAAPSWADNSSPVLAQGTADMLNGAPDVQAQVLLLAEPSEAALKDLPVGQSIDVPVVASTMTDNQGNYELAQPSTIPDTADDSGLVNYQIVVSGAGTGAFGFSDTDPTTNTANSALSRTKGTPRAAHTHFINVHEVSRQLKRFTPLDVTPDGTYCTKTKKTDLGPQSSTVVRAYSTTTDAEIKVHYTTGASSTLGIGLSATADGDYSASGSIDREVSSDDKVTLPTDTHVFSDAFNTDFDYAKYFNQCTGTGGSRSYYTSEAVYHYGGERIATLSSVPSATHCDTYAKGGGQEVTDKTATTFSGGVDIKKWIGINLDAKTGYSSEASVDMDATYGSMTICGTTGSPTNPGVFVAKG